MKKLEDEKADWERMRQVMENNLQDAREENDDLRRKILGLEAQVKELKTFCDDLQRAETRLKDKIGRIEVSVPRCGGSGTGGPLFHDFVDNICLSYSRLSGKGWKSLWKK